MTTDTKTRLAQHVYEHEHVNGHEKQVNRPHRPAPPVLNVNPEVSADVVRPLCSPDLQQLSLGPLFSSDQLSQLCGIIGEVNGLNLANLLLPAASTVPSTTHPDIPHRAP